MEKNKWKVFIRTQSYLKPYLIPYIFFVFISGLGQFLTFSSVGVFLKEILLIVNGEEQNFTINEALLYLCGIFIFTCLMGFGIYHIKKIEQKIRMQIREEMLSGYINADEKTVETIVTSEVMNRMSMDLTKMVDLVGWIMAGGIYMPIISGICSVIYLCFIDYRIMGLCILIAFLEYIFLRLFSKRRASELASITLEKSNVLQFVNEEFDGTHEIHIFDLNATFIEKIKKHLIKLNSHIHCYNALNSTRLFISMFYIQCIAEVVLLVVGAYLASLKIIIFANIMIAIQLSDQIEQMIVALASFKTFVDEYAVYEKRVYEIIDLKGQKFTYKEKKNTLLALDYVCFSYDKEEVLHDITLDIKKDKKIAIVGESGSGKSTILKLLLNLYEPTSGTVYKEKDIAISYMPQFSSMFITTVSNNISLNMCANKDVVEQVAMNAGADEFIRNKEEAYEYVIQKDDSGYSGGEKERISLARTLYKDSEIIVFDEPTSALDERTENQIKKAIADITDRTIVVVTHRLSFIQDYDEIVVLEKGKIKEIGTHQELMQHKDTYYQMYQLQQIQ